MFNFLTKKVLLVAVGVMIGSEVMWKLVQIMRKHFSNCDPEVNEVLFFSDDLKKLEQDRKEKKLNSFSRLLTLISGCKKTLDLCLFLITLKDMASLVIRLMQEGVRVRLIVDKSNIGIAGCQFCPWY